MKPTIIVKLGNEFITKTEKGEIVSTIEVLSDGSPSWDEAGICDERGIAGPDGYESLVEAFTALERLAVLSDEPIWRLTDNDGHTVTVRA